MKRTAFALFTVVFCLFARELLAEVKAIAHCSMTGRFGIGEGETGEDAAGDAVQKCIVGGGQAGCCELQGTTDDARCIALATAPGAEVKRGFGSANNQERAERIARRQCGTDCKLEVSVCQSE
jgi:hypothetical protein